MAIFELELNECWLWLWLSQYQYRYLCRYYFYVTINIYIGCILHIWVNTWCSSSDWCQYSVMNAFLPQLSHSFAQITHTHTHRIDLCWKGRARLDKAKGIQWNALIAALFLSFVNFYNMLSVDYHSKLLITRNKYMCWFQCHLFDESLLFTMALSVLCALNYRGYFMYIKCSDEPHWTQICTEPGIYWVNPLLYKFVVNSKENGVYVFCTQIHVDRINVTCI